MPSVLYPGRGIKHDHLIKQMEQKAHSCTGLLGALKDPVIQARAVTAIVRMGIPGRRVAIDLPGNLNSVELHAHACIRVSFEPAKIYNHLGRIPQYLLTKDGVVLLIFTIGPRADDCAKVEVFDLLVELVDPVAPLFLACLAFHLILIDSSGGIETREFFHEGLVDLVIHLSEAQLRALDLLQNRPVCHQMFDSCPGKKSVMIELDRLCAFYETLSRSKYVTDLSLRTAFPSVVLS